MYNRIVYIIFGLTIVSGCAGPYFKQGMKYNDSLKYLSSTDTLKVSNYILHSFVTRSAPFYPVTEQFLNSDSVIEKLMVAFTNNAIPYDDQTLSGINIRDSMKMKRLIKCKFK